jgi:hypothetical protein
MNGVSTYWTRFAQSRFSRRGVLAAAGAAGVASLLAACSKGNKPSATSSWISVTGSSTHA